MKFTTYLVEILVRCDEHKQRSVIALATQTLGFLVPLSGAYAHRIVENNIKLMLKWIALKHNEYNFVN